jgi:hypothetical protein
VYTWWHFLHPNFSTGLDPSVRRNPTNCAYILYMSDYFEAPPTQSWTLDTTWFECNCMYQCYVGIEYWHLLGTRYTINRKWIIGIVNICEFSFWVKVIVNSSWLSSLYKKWCSCNCFVTNTNNLFLRTMILQILSKV